MREIKFRAWDDKKKEWLLGYGYKSLGGFSLEGECMLLGEWSSVLNDAMQGRIDLKVMQFTGLIDAKGKEIWEGDILKSFHYQTGPVTWAENCWYVKQSDPTEIIFPNPEQSEIIGNVYENPELLK